MAPIVTPPQRLAVKIRIHPHAQARLAERGAAEAEVFATIEQGDSWLVITVIVKFFGQNGA